MRPLSGIVLAGGRSSRMGRDKAALMLDGATLLDRATALLRAAGAGQVHVSGARPGGIADAVDGRGPLGGLATVLRACPDGDVLVLPVDMPGLTAADLASLRDALAAAPAACFAGHPLPWAARVDDALRSRVDALLAAGPSRASLRALHRAIGGIERPTPATADLRNVNTPADWAAYAR